MALDDAEKGKRPVGVAGLGEGHDEVVQELRVGLDAVELQLPVELEEEGGVRLAGGADEAADDEAVVGVVGGVAAAAHFVEQAEGLVEVVVEGAGGDEGVVGERGESGLTGEEEGLVEAIGAAEGVDEDGEEELVGEA